MRSPMTRRNRHRIQRQIVELAVGGVAEAPEAQRQLAQPFWDRVMPELEAVFDRAAGPDELLRLDRLELDLGPIGGGDWPSAFKTKLIEELTRSLAQFTAVSERTDDDEDGERPRTEPWRQFLFFLAHGRLPWWAVEPMGEWNDVLSTGSDADWSALRETIASDSRARLRLVYSVEDEPLARAIARWSGVPATDRVLEQLTPAHLQTALRRQWRRGFWMVVLDWVSAGIFHPSIGPRLARDLKMLRAMYESNATPSSARPLTDESPGRGSWIRTADDLPEPWRAWWLTHDETAPFEPAATEPPIGARESKRRAAADSLPRANAPKKPQPAVEDGAIYLTGAGVVLVHPFLEQLFRERDLLDGRAFRGLEARDRAVQMIGLIAFGRVDVQEHDLVLAKVLCGAAIEEPLEPVLLEDADVGACEELVRAVLQHWTALRSSSPALLREQFFLREGKLEDVDSGRRLTIERRAQDVLLARLPWGFGVVGPPWLNNRIFVHWLD
jgi:hypothetical protein